MEGKAKTAHHGFTHTHVEHHPDGSHTVHHVHSEGTHKDVKHAAMNLDHVHDSLQEHLGEPSEGTQELEQGVHSIPAEHAAPAGIPMPGAASAAPVPGV
jgi:hypothetical protein